MINKKKQYLKKKICLAMKIIMCTSIEYSLPYIGYGGFYTVHFYEGTVPSMCKHRFSLIGRKITYYSM
ncbi:hypothetical protein APHWI1_0342 [Anaplasma phagocytophilum str. ApWI1]|uniref:Uncharacterized protein n=1 Tax=Anaplasma phagocytophilum str. ApWI1 TaxID=1359155 RepID=A0A0F3PW52_ANAPH|nr:hypothetical protein APHHGE2_1139 [Anaplasma phagocytophilum str. HGE2]KJV84101.1 hypothetical protein APHWI1_0342 [Anaplasma phagocytophilum str. ApWI1]